MPAFSIEYVAIPLGQVESIQTGAEFSAFIVANIVFNPIDERSLSRKDVVEAVNSLVVLSDEAQISLRSNLPSKSYSLTRLGDAPDTLRNRLLGYLLGDVEAELELPLVGEQYINDPEFDIIERDRYVNTGALYYRTVPIRNILLMNLVTTVYQTLQNGGISFISQERVATVTSHLARVLHEELLGRPRFNDSVSDAILAASLGQAATQRQTLETAVRAALESVDFDRFEHLIRGTTRSDDLALRSLSLPDTAVSEQELVERLKNRDLNTLLIAASKEPVLSRYLGLVTEWRVHVPQFETGDFELALAIGDETLSTPTAVRFEPSIVAPRSRDRLSKAGAFSLLNDDANQPRYRTTQVSADGALVKTFLLQDSNRIQSWNKEPPTEEALAERNIDWRVYSHPDITPPEEVDTHGFNQAFSGGVSFHAPADDLVNPRRTDTDPYFLEDLWIGFRIDIASTSSPAPSVYYSLHEQVREYTFANPLVSAALSTIQRLTEDYVDREQITKKVDEDGSAGTYLDTTLARWTGLGSAHVLPIRGHYEGTTTSAPDQSPLYSVSISQKAQSVPRLLYKTNYSYRLRNVFQGGVGLSRGDADRILEELEQRSLAAGFRQSFTYVRSEPYSAGEIIDFHVPAQGSATPHADQTIFLLSDHDRRDILVAPAGIDLDQCRFHGLVGKSVEEFSDLGDVYVATDIRRLFAEAGTDSVYFCDPDVHAIDWDIVSVGRNLLTASSETEVHDGVVCDIVPHWHVASGIASYGEAGKWRKFRPIKLNLIAVSDGAPRAESRSTAPSEIRVYVPKGDVLDIYLTPKITSEDIANTSLFQDMNLSTGEDATHVPEIPPISPFVTQRKVRVAHAIKRPLPPIIRTISARRFANENPAYIQCVAHVDALTAGQAFFSAEWETVEDNPNQPEPIAVSGSAKTETRSIAFKLAPVPTYSAFALALSETPAQVAQLLHPRQCIENTVVYSLPMNRTTTADAPTDEGQSRDVDPSKHSQTSAKIALADQRHHEMILRLVARSRYRSLYDDVDDQVFEASSEPVTVHALSNFVPPAPQISHIVPTMQRSESLDPAGWARLEDAFSISIYVDRPWLITGNYERLAIGCSSDEGDELDFNDRTAKFVTKWGEDPLERPKLEATKRPPRASDFGSLKPDGVTYHDNIPLAKQLSRHQADESNEPSSAASQLVLALASYELEYEKDTQLWRADIAFNVDFFGWLRLALYRHQPYAEEGKYISIEPVPIYAAKLQNELITYFLRDGVTNINIGPVFDRSVTYDLVAMTGFGENLAQLTTHVVPLESYDAGQGVIHFIRFEREDVRYGIRKRRAGAEQAIIAVI